jgi:hypothetical protein
LNADTGEPAQSSVSPFIWDTQEVEKIITDASAPTDEITDWMKDAGWEPVGAESIQQAVMPGETIPEEELPQEDLAQADMPDWLKGIAPLGVIEEKLDEFNRLLQIRLSLGWISRDPGQPIQSSNGLKERNLISLSPLRHPKSFPSKLPRMCLTG